MVYYSPQQSSEFEEKKTVRDIIKLKEIKGDEPKKRFYKAKWFWVFSCILIFIIVSSGYAAHEINSTFNKISNTKGSILKTAIRMLPLENSIFKILPLEETPVVKSAKENSRINFLVLGIRGRGDPHGGLLTDSIIIVSVKPKTNQVALISIPRDLYVEIPGYGSKEKINTAYALGERNSQFSGGGLILAKEVISEVTGLPIHYAISIDFEAFKEIVDTLGGVTIYLDKPFCDPFQFAEGKICLTQGKQELDGKKALLYVRSRYSTNDFDRSRRQQQVLIAVKDKAFSTGILANPLKINSFLNTLKNNVRTDIKLWELQDLIEIIQKIENPQIIHKVFDTSPEGLLYSARINGSYVLLPEGDNFKKIQEACRDIFN